MSEIRKCECGSILFYKESLETGVCWVCHDKPPKEKVLKPVRCPKCGSPERVLNKEDGRYYCNSLGCNEVLTPPPPVATGHPEFYRILDEMKALHEKKAADYGLGKDMLANCRGSTEFGLPAWVGVAVRMNDKMTRLKSFAQKGTLANESVEDSLIDLANYSVLALILYREIGGKTS